MAEIHSYLALEKMGMIKLKKLPAMSGATVAIIISRSLLRHIPSLCLYFKNNVRNESAQMVIK